MAVTFRKGLSSLLRDLTRGGFGVRLVEKFANGRGRHADVHLYNGVTLSWDPQSQTVWAEGPLKDCAKVERYLRARYSKRGLKRAILTSYYFATRFVRGPVHRLRAHLKGDENEPRNQRSGPAASPDVSARSMQDRPAA